MFYSDVEYKETMKQLLLQIVLYNFNVFEVSSKTLPSIFILYFLMFCL